MFGIMDSVCAFVCQHRVLSTRFSCFKACGSESMCASVRACVRACVRAFVRVFVCMCLCASVFACNWVGLSMCVSVSICIYVCVCLRAWLDIRFG
jgi:hypothetical protein